MLKLEVGKTYLLGSKALMRVICIDRKSDLGAELNTIGLMWSKNAPYESLWYGSSSGISRTMPNLCSVIGEWTAEKFQRIYIIRWVAPNRPSMTRYEWAYSFNIWRCFHQNHLVEAMNEIEVPVTDIMPRTLDHFVKILSL